MHHEGHEEHEVYFFLFFMPFVVSFLFINVFKTMGKPGYGEFILDRKTHMAFIQAFKIVADAD